MTPTEEDGLAFAVAALVPAVVTGLAFIGITSAAGLGGALFAGGVAFAAAFFVAGLHIVLLAMPLHMLLSRRGPPKPGLVLASSTLIGALPIPVIFQSGAQAFMIFGLAGLIGGVAFLGVSRRPGVSGEG